MQPINDRQSLVDSALTGIPLPDGIQIRAWVEADFPAIQRLSTTEGWPTPKNRPADALSAWKASWPALVLSDGGEVIGFLRALTDGCVTTYIAEMLIAAPWRRRQFGAILIEVCHQLYPSTRLDLLATESSEGFYEAEGFRSFHGYRKSFR